MGSERVDWLFWMHLIGGRTVQPVNVPPWSRIHKHLPLNKMDDALGRSDIWWKDWLSHLDANDPYWEPLNLQKAITDLNTPALHMTGWWDGQLAGARYYHQAAVQSAAPQHLIIGPWDTAGVRRPQRKVGGFDFGPRSVLDMDQETLQFFDECLKDKAPLTPRPAAKLFTTGRNEWVESESWPDSQKPTAQRKVFYPSSSMGANTRRGDGYLATVANKESGTDVVTHNPKMPVQFQPNFVSFGTAAQAFTLDQAHITARDEALVYTAEPTQDTITLSGRTEITVSVKTNAPDADVFILLSDVFPGGTRDLHLTHGALRLSTSEAYQPGKMTTITISLTELVHDLLPSHQLRLTLTPSLFPLYASNPQGGEYVTEDQPYVEATEFILADTRLTIYEGDLKRE